jgi:hypothetical protein
MSTSAARDPSVFILESLTLDDERAERREGHLLYEMLHLADKPADYRYIRTKQELIAMLQQFDDSGKRYLHISCHGSDMGISLTLDDMPFAEFGKIVRPYLKDRRLFFSACSVATKELARSIMSREGCYSVIGPTNNVYFHDAAIMWAVFYHLVFKANRKAMNRDRVSAALQKVCNTFGTSVRYFSRTNTLPYFSTTTYSPEKTGRAAVD